jgi:hypothetical protein
MMVSLAFLSVLPLEIMNKLICDYITRKILNISIFLVILVD